MARSHQSNNSNLNRRRFLQSGAAAAAASSLASPAIHAAKRSDSNNPVLGAGDHQYECIHDWGMENLPGKAHYGHASHGVAVDAQGLIYITHYGDPGTIFVFDADAKFVKSMGDLHQTVDKDSETPLGRGHGIDIRKEGADEFIYLSPSDPALDFVKLDMKGEVVWRKNRAAIHEESNKYPEGAPFRPTNTSFAPDGGYFLGDGYGSNLLHQYDAQDNYIRTIGSTGKEDGQFQTPHGQWHDDRDGTPKLVVADRANKRLQWFDMEGKYLSQLGGFLFPADVDLQGEILLVPDLHCRITLLDKNNQVIAQLGDDPVWREKALEGFKMRGQREKWVPGQVHPSPRRLLRRGRQYLRCRMG